MRLGTWAESLPRATPTSKLGCPKPLQGQEAQVHTWPTAQLHGAAPPRPCQPWRELYLARGLPAEALRGAISVSLEILLVEPSAGPRCGANSASLETLRGELWQRPNHPTG